MGVLEKPNISLSFGFVNKCVISWYLWLKQKRSFFLPTFSYVRFCLEILSTNMTHLAWSRWLCILKIHIYAMPGQMCREYSKTIWEWQKTWTKFIKLVFVRSPRYQDLRYILQNTKPKLNNGLSSTHITA